MFILKFIILSLFLSISFCQDIPQISDFQVSSKKYITDNNGNILMHVNIWGHVKNPGRHVVYDGIDMATLISLVGGPEEGADMKKVRLYREHPDKKNNSKYIINLMAFLSNGDRSSFIEIKPNDTIIIPQSKINIIVDKISKFNIVLNLLNLYFTIQKSN
jgi:hypothetical protein|tara:strand:- start:377 stop:856 length:480 start_codon:yes stop_codon:yes gene_type:complete